MNREDKACSGYMTDFTFFFSHLARKEEKTAENTRAQKMHITVLLHVTAAKNNGNCLTSMAQYLQ